MNEIEAQRQYYAERAISYDREHEDSCIEHETAVRLLSAMLPELRPTTLLDVGCGTGRSLAFLKARHPELELTGIEPVEELLAVAATKDPGRLVQGSGEALPFPNESFDVVCEFGVLHHVKDANRVVAEMLRVARKAVFISDINRFGQSRFWVGAAKLGLYKLGLWPLAFWLRTRGRGYAVTEGDGVAYSYSVYDSYALVNAWAERVIIIPTGRVTGQSWLNPLLTNSHALLAGLRPRD